MFIYGHKPLYLQPFRLSKQGDMLRPLKINWIEASLNEFWVNGYLQRTYMKNVYKKLLLDKK